MPTVFDYLDWRGDLSFEVSPPNEVDVMILSQIVYLDLDSEIPEEGGAVTLRTAMRSFVRRNQGKRLYLGRILPPEMVHLAVRAAKTARFGAIELRSFVNRIRQGREQSQFCAMTATLCENLHMLIYRGTDDTLVGWKENFNMSFMMPVPAQIEAELYFRRMAEECEGELILCGHSKGGNLAVYAAVEAEEQYGDRVRAVYNLDGPGFDLRFIGSDSYAALRDRIYTLLPQSSVVGMLLEHEERYEVVKSNASGLLQHSGFTWEALGAGFIRLDEVSEESRRIDRSLKLWLSGMSPAERERVVDSIYEILSASGAKTLTDISADKVRLAKAWNTLDAQSRSVILKCLSLLIKQPQRKKAGAKQAKSRQSTAVVKVMRRPQRGAK